MLQNRKMKLKRWEEIDFAGIITTTNRFDVAATSKERRFNVM